MDFKTKEIGGTPMRWADQGAGDIPAVLIHGIPTSPALWRNVIPLLQTRSLAWEMVGYGGSWREAERHDISVAAQAEFLTRWLASVGVQRALLVGHDLGGGVAQIAAVRHPESIAGLVLTNAICYDSWPIPSVKTLRAMGGLVRRMPPKIFRVLFSAFLRQGHDDADMAADSVAAHWPFYDHHAGALAFVRQIRSLDVNDTLAISDWLSELKVPARIVWGAADRFQKIAYGRRLAHDLGAELDSIDQGKHFTPEDHPERVAAAVNRVVKECESE